MNGAPIYPNGAIPNVLCQVRRRRGNTPKGVALLGDVLGWIESRPRMPDAVKRGGMQ
ncbi:hypothetical protein J2778_002096 [Paraburkholderia graminis]|nr:hypothetical protein [Paraburkholderia graminis]